MTKETFDKMLDKQLERAEKIATEAETKAETNPLFKVKVGDTVAILKRSGDDFVPCSLSAVTKVSPKFIETSFYKFYRNGMPATRLTQGKRLSVDRVLIAQMQQAQINQAGELQRKEQSLREKHARKTYQLACQIVNAVEPEKSIAALEALGETSLQRILDELASVKAL